MTTPMIVLVICLVAANGFGASRAAAQGLPPEEPATFRTFGSAAGYGGPSQETLGCTLTNVGATSIRVKKLLGFDEGGASLPVVFGGCPGAGQVFTLAPGATCQLAVRVGNNHAAGCRGLVDRKASLRGRADISAGGVVGVLTRFPIE